MRPIRVLIVDDAVVVRRMVSDVLSEDDGIEVVGVAANGRIGLQKLAQVTPDVVTLDIEMPELDGLATLEELRKSYPTLPVIMFSTLTERGASATLHALALGATDYVTKPANVGSVQLAKQRIREDLIPRIYQFGSRAAGRTEQLARRVPVPTSMAVAPPRPRTPAKPAGPIEVLAIGSSTGGPNALVALLERLPADFPVPIVITQHMPPLFTKLLAERLTTRTSLRFAEGETGAVLTPGHGWVAPGDWHMHVVRDGKQARLALDQAPPENSCRPAVDVMLRSVAKAFGAQALAVILTGMGQDGLRGCRELHDLGATIFAQDEASSVVWGMPGFVANAGIAERVLPLDALADAIMTRVAVGRRSPALASTP